MGVKLFILLFAGFSVPQKTNGCSPKDIRGCEDQFLTHLNTTRAEFEAGIIPDMSEDRLRIVCRAYAAYSTCLNTYIAGCNSSIQIQFLGTDETYKFICNAGFQDHARYADCLSSDEVEPGTVHCIHVMQAQILDMAEFITRSRLCAILNDVLDCIVQATAAICGLDAANHRRVLETLSIQPLADSFACELVSRLPWTALPTTTTSVVPHFTTTTTSWFLPHFTTTTSFLPHFTTTTPVISYFTTTAKQPDVNEKGQTYFTTTAKQPNVNEKGQTAASNKGDDGGLSTGAIIGIAVGALVLLVVITCVIFFIVRPRNRDENAQQGFINPGYPATRTTDEEAVYQTAAAPRYTDPPPAYDNKTYEVGLKPAELPVPENQKKTLLAEETSEVVYANVAGKE